MNLLIVTGFALAVSASPFAGIKDAVMNKIDPEVSMVRAIDNCADNRGRVTTLNERSLLCAMPDNTVTKYRVLGWTGAYWITADYDGFKSDCGLRSANLVSRTTVNGKEYPVCAPKAPHRQLDKWK